MKLVKDEKGSAEARDFVIGSLLVSSELVVTEVRRAVRRAALYEAGFNLAVRLVMTEILLEEVALYLIDRPALRRAGMLFELGLRSLDAIHVVAALDLRPIAAFLTYDKRQARAARDAGLPVRAPGA